MYCDPEVFAPSLTSRGLAVVVENKWREMAVVFDRTGDDGRVVRVTEEKGEKALTASPFVEAIEYVRRRLRSNETAYVYGQRIGESVPDEVWRNFPLPVGSSCAWQLLAIVHTG